MLVFINVNKVLLLLLDVLCLDLYYILVFIIFVVMLVGGILQFVFREKVLTTLDREMYAALPLNGQRREYIRAWDDTQTYLHCCGVLSYRDWNDNVPESCYQEVYPGKSGGAILGGSAVWSLLRMSYYFWTSDLGVELSSSVLFMAGALLCLPTCWLSTLVPYHPRSLSLLATLMTLVTIAMVMLSLGIASVMSLSHAVREPHALNASMARAMALDAFDPAVRSSFAAMQLELRCCGINSNTDWLQHRRTLPPACCGRVWNGKVGDQCESPLFPAGCLRPALNELRNFANSLSALASAMIIVMAVTLFTSAYTLVSGVVERSEARALKQAAPLRIACLAHPPAHPVVPEPPLAPFFTLASPASLPSHPSPASLISPSP